MSYTAAAYIALFQNLLPLGQAWPRDVSSTLAKTLAGLATEYVRLDLRCDTFRNEADPRTAQELLTDWDRVAGLPDPCIGRLPSDDRRRSALIRKLTTIRGQSVAYFVALGDAILEG